MMLVDINIFEDVIRKREGWIESSEILTKVKNKEIKGHISALTPPIIYFLRIRDKFTDEDAREEMDKITQHFEIISLTADILGEAKNNKNFTDFEDAIHFHSAMEKGLKIIITRNKKDFRGVQDQIRVLTPEEFLTDWNKEK